MSERVTVLPEDEHNRTLVANVHPGDHVNPEPAPCYNLVVVGAGSAGLVSAAGAAGLGAKVALVERHLLGGDCLNVGCVPSKGVIRASRAAAEVRGADRFGVGVDGTKVDFGKAMERMRRLRTGISHHDSVKRFSDLGIDVFLGQGRFAGPDSVEVDGKTLKFKKAVIATGGRPYHPPIEGLADAGFLTNETVFSLTDRPDCLAVVGGGPIGCELAQAFRRLGSEVTIVERAKQFLAREDPDAVEVLIDVFRREGIRVLLDTSLERATVADGRKELHVKHNGEKEIIRCNEILVGVGRVPNVEDLELEKAGVAYDGHGVKVDDRLRTTNTNIFGAGDICSKFKFTHTADAAARIVIQNALFGGRKKAGSLVIPWCTYTDPEIAHVGMYERDARGKDIEVETFKVPLAEVDRAILDGEDEGFVKIHVKKGTDRILGATIVAAHAGEMISEISVAMAGKVGLKKLSGVIHPYPTQAEAIRRVGDAFNRTRLTPTVKKWFSRWLAWRRR